MYLLQIIVARQNGLLSVSILKVISIFVILCFHVFNKMTIRRIKKKSKMVMFM